MNKYMSMGAKLVMFGVMTLWTLTFLIGSIVMWQPFLDTIDAADVGWAGPILAIWYVFTAVIVGIFCASRAFSYVGKWELQNGEEEK